MPTSSSLKGVILAGGTGSRLFPLTKITNKHLLPIYDRPMISYAVETMVGAGVDEVMIVTGGTHAGEFLRLLGNGHEAGLVAPDVRLPGEPGRHRRGARPGGALRRARPGRRDARRQHLRAVDRHGRRRPSAPEPAGARVILTEMADAAHLSAPGRRRARRRRRDRRDRREAGRPAEPLRGHRRLLLRRPRSSTCIQTLEPSGRGELEITDVNNFYVARGALALRRRRRASGATRASRSTATTSSTTSCARTARTARPRPRTLRGTSKSTASRVGAGSHPFPAGVEPGGARLASPTHTVRVRGTERGFRRLATRASSFSRCAHGRRSLTMPRQEWPPPLTGAVDFRPDLRQQQVVLARLARRADLDPRGADRVVLRRAPSRCPRGRRSSAGRSTAGGDHRARRAWLPPRVPPSSSVSNVTVCGVPDWLETTSTIWPGADGARARRG